MRKILIILILISGLGLGVGLFNSLVKSGEITQVTVPIPSPSATITREFKIEPYSEVLAPSSFSIPKLGVKSVMVESVGLDGQNKMDIPKDEENVAWYNLGAKPGEVGNAVLAGHYDKKTGEPAVFYDLSKLEPGDELVVMDKGNTEYIYKVTKKVSYELDEFPLQEVFGTSHEPRLNLITCEGTYDKSSKLYSHRLVVYSELR